MLKGKNKKTMEAARKAMASLDSMKTTGGDSRAVTSIPKPQLPNLLMKLRDKATKGKVRRPKAAAAALLIFHSSTSLLQNLEQ